MNPIKMICLFLSVLFCTFLCNAEHEDKHIYWCRSVDAAEAEKYPTDEVYKCNVRTGEITKVCDLKGYLIDSFETDCLYAAELDLSGEKPIWNILRLDLNGNQERMLGSFDADRIVRFLGYANETLYYLKALEKELAIFEGINRDGTVISYSHEIMIPVWRDADDGPVYPYRENYASYFAVVSPDGKILSYNAYPEKNTTFNVDYGDMLLYLPGQEIINLGQIDNPAWIDENRFFFHSKDMLLQKYDVRSRSSEYHLSNSGTPVKILEQDEEAYFCVSNDGKYALFVPYDDWILIKPYPQMMNLETGKIKKFRKIHTRKAMNAKLFLTDF